MQYFLLQDSLQQIRCILTVLHNLAIFAFKAKEHYQDYGDIGGNQKKVKGVGNRELRKKILEKPSCSGSIWKENQLTFPIKDPSELNDFV